jgi:sulfite exporter TauE/SafE
VYALAAFLLHSFRAVFRPEWQQFVSIALGLLLLFAGILYFLPLRKAAYPWSGFVRTRLGYFFSSPSVLSLFAAGALNGMLPCGMVYMALSGAMAAETPLAASLLMFVFGAGTVPMLVFVSLVKHKAGFIASGRFRKMVPIALFAFGSLFVLRGMNLGIPYLSPRISIEGGVVKASCCHKQ